MSYGRPNPAQTGTIKDALTSASSLIGSFGGLYGSYDDYGSKKKDDCEGISLATLLTTFASIGVVFFTVFTKLTMIGRRRKREADDDYVVGFESFLDVAHVMFSEGIYYVGVRHIM